MLYELGANDSTEASDLRAALQIDAGQLSRLLKRLEEQGLVARGTSPLDARRQQVRLTEKAGDEYGVLDRRSAEEMAAFLDEAGGESSRPCRAAESD